MPKLLSQKFFISLLLPGSCEPKSLEGRPIITSPFFYILNINLANSHIDLQNHIC